MKPSIKKKNRLARRVSDFNEMVKHGGTPYGNGYYVPTGGGKQSMYHKPGSLKKGGPKGRGLK